MFILAYPEDTEHIAYFDASGNKYIAKGGTLAWRINNPGLVQSHSHVAKQNASIGACGPYAIFPSPENGHQSLSSWLRLKKYFNGTLRVVAQHYQPYDPEGFILKLNALADLSLNKKLKSYSKYDWQLLLQSIAKLCHFEALGNEDLSLLPRINGKIENGQDQEDVIQLLAYRDAELHVNPFNPAAIENYIKQRMNFYKEAFEIIKNVTVLDPDAFMRHGFDNKCYQTVLHSIVKKFQQQADQ